MTDAVLTLVGLPALGVVLLAAGLWGRRHVDVLLGTMGVPELREHRRRGLTRGAVTLVVVGAFFTVGGTTAALAVALRG